MIYNMIAKGSGGSAAISITDTPDSGGGTVRTITALDISDTTATASDVASGKYFYTAAGTKTQGTASGGGSTVYSGTYMSATRPSANVVFSCPGATHFVMRVANNETPDLTLGVGFSVFAYADTTYTSSIGSNNSGSNTTSTDWCYNTGDRHNYFIGIDFTAGGVEAIYYNHNYYKWFQAGLTYSWYAW